MKPVRLVFFILAATLVVTVTASGCRPKDDGTVVHLNGRIEAPLVDMSPKVAGRVVEVLVREGDRVKAGDLLARLDLGDTALAVERVPGRGAGLGGGDVRHGRSLFLGASMKREKFAVR